MDSADVGVDAIARKAGAASGHAIRSPCVKPRSKMAVLLASSIKSSAVRCALTPDPL